MADSKNYTFDMEQLLNAYNNDAEKLAQAFTNSLNAELAKRNRTNRLNKLAQKVAEAWEELVNEYAKVRDQATKDINVKDFYIDAKVVMDILNMLIKLMPYVDMMSKYDKKLDEVVSVKKDKTYEDAIRRFFKENNIE